MTTGRRAACGLVACSKRADFRLSYKRFDDPKGRVLQVNRCREHRYMIPRSAAKLVKISTPWFLR